ncbi:odorant receptor 94a-like [Colletes latitarsis]|uniref:odorant receptor 94a-like n=1 Tax=Colletes latitarsis TaxID=2605962 RepID=UPI00403696FE
MSIMRWTFRILVICGCWQPPSWTSPVKTFLYTLYRAIVLSLVYTVTFLQFMDIVINVQNQDEFSDNFYLLLAMLVSCHKGYSLVKNRESIAALNDILEQEPFMPENAEEIGIRTRFDKRSELMTLLYAVLIESTCSVLSICTASLFTDLPKRKLLYSAWLPFTYTNRSLYFVAYGHQLVALYGLAFINLACDVFVIGLSAHVCCQQEILKHRLKELTLEIRPDFGKIVRFHNYLYRYAFMIQENFKVLLAIQLLSSTLVVCFNLYELTNTPLTSPKYLEFVMFMACMMAQSFIYCWYGNELKLKSVELVEAIFHLDWMFLVEDTKKSLLIIMSRAMIPIELTCAYIVKMDVDTFVAILKLSYSSYNLLQRTK